MSALAPASPSPYIITRHTRTQAKRLGVTVARSTRKGKKIDVFRDGKKIASVGALGYGDFPTFRRTRGATFADNKRRLYKMRHEKDRHVRDSAGFYADQLLW
jgi:hypothetical protein